jgi:hypothetical protein
MFRQREERMTWTELLKGEAEIAYASAAKLMEKVDPESLRWKPQTGQNWMTVGQLLKHISGACGVGCRGFVTGEWALPGEKKWTELRPEEMLPPAEKLPVVKSVDEARNLLSRDKAVALEMIDRAGERDLANKRLAAPWAPDTPNFLGVQLLRMIQHLEKHNSQLFYYLKLQGKAVSTPDLWG